LHEAVASRNEAIVSMLLAHGADANILVGDRYTPLDWAIENGDESIADLLRAYGGKESKK
jgi:ankyrin repeat protein